MSPEKDNSIIIYDGECELCRSAVRFLQTGSSPAGFKFVPSSDPSAHQMLDEFRIEKSTADKTVILIDKDRVYTKSAAIIKALQKKGRLWRLTGFFLLVPAFLRNRVYDWIADRRK